MLIDGGRQRGFYYRIKQDVAVIFEESIKRGLDQWGVEAASTGKSVGKALKVVGGSGKGELLLRFTQPWGLSKLAYKIHYLNEV